MITNESILMFQMWFTRQEFLVGVLIPLLATLFLLCFKSVRKGINYRLAGQMSTVAAGMIAIHIASWNLGLIAYGDFVNAFLIELPIIYSVVRYRSTLNSLSAAVCTWFILFMTDLICAAYLSVTHSTLHYFTSIGSAGQGALIGFSDGLFMFPIITALMIAGINKIRAVFSTQENFRKTEMAVNI